MAETAPKLKKTRSWNLFRKRRNDYAKESKLVVEEQPYASLPRTTSTTSSNSSILQGAIFVPASDLAEVSLVHSKGSSKATTCTQTILESASTTPCTIDTASPGSTASPLLNEPAVLTAMPPSYELADVKRILVLKEYTNGGTEENGMETVLVGRHNDHYTTTKASPTDNDSSSQAVEIEGMTVGGSSVGNDSDDEEEAEDEDSVLSVPGFSLAAVLESLQEKNAVEITQEPRPNAVELIQQEEWPKMKRSFSGNVAPRGQILYEPDNSLEREPALPCVETELEVEEGTEQEASSSFSLGSKIEYGKEGMLFFDRQDKNDEIMYQAIGPKGQLIYLSEDERNEVDNGDEESETDGEDDVSASDKSDRSEEQEQPGHHNNDNLYDSFISDCEANLTTEYEDNGATCCFMSRPGTD